MAIGVLVDLEGPKIRVGPLRNAEPIFLSRGEPIVIVCEPGFIGRKAEDGAPVRIGTRYLRLAHDAKPGERVLLDDGMIELKVGRVDGKEIHARVVHGGLLSSTRGLTSPALKVSTSALSDKDRGDLEVALAAGVDFVAISFVRKADDVRRLKAIIESRGGDVRVIARYRAPGGGRRHRFHPRGGRRDHGRARGHGRRTGLRGRAGRPEDAHPQGHSNTQLNE